jgi:transcriptional antiterminator RfaH
MTWYAVHTHAREELKALANLRRQGYVAYLPRYLKLRRHARRIEKIAAPLFPRYLFALVDESRQSWSAIRNTFGVSQIVCNGNQPVPVSERIIDAIRGRENESGLVALNDTGGFSSGDALRIVDGPMCDQDAIFDCMTDENRVTVMLNLLGRSIRATLPLDAVAAA